MTLNNPSNVKPLTIRCDALILAKIKAIAKASRRSMNSQIEDCLATFISEFETKNGNLEINQDELY